MGMLILDRKKIPIFTPCPQIKFTDLSSRPARRSSGGLARRSSGGLVRRHFYPPYFLSAVFMADWRGVLGKSGCCEEECKLVIIRDADKALYFVFPETIYWLTIVKKDLSCLSKRSVDPAPRGRRYRSAVPC